GRLSRPVSVPARGSAVCRQTRRSNVGIFRDQARLQRLALERRLLRQDKGFRFMSVGHFLSRLVAGRDAVAPLCQLQEQEPRFVGFHGGWTTFPRRLSFP